MNGVYSNTTLIPSEIHTNSALYQHRKEQKCTSIKFGKYSTSYKQKIHQTVDDSKEPSEKVTVLGNKFVFDNYIFKNMNIYDQCLQT